MDCHSGWIDDPANGSIGTWRSPLDAGKETRRWIDVWHCGDDKTANHRHGTRCITSDSRVACDCVGHRDSDRSFDHCYDGIRLQYMVRLAPRIAGIPE